MALSKLDRAEVRSRRGDGAGCARCIMLRVAKRGENRRGGAPSDDHAAVYVRRTSFADIIEDSTVRSALLPLGGKS